MTAKFRTMLGFRWFEGDPITCVVNTDPERSVAISVRQLTALITFVRTAAEGSNQSRNDIEPRSWLLGAEAATESEMLSPLLRGLEEKGQQHRSFLEAALVVQKCAQPLRRDYSETVAPQRHQPVCSSDSSSVTAGGESAGELPTSPRIKIVAQRVTRVDGDAGEMTFECDHFRVVLS